MNQLVLYNHHVLYIGVSFDNVLHKHHAAQICIGLDATFQLIDEHGETYNHESAIIAANASHQLKASETKIATLFLDVQCGTYQQLVEQYELSNEHPIQPIVLSKKIVSQLKVLNKKTTTNFSAKEEITSLIAELAEQQIRSEALDLRIVKVLQRLNSNTESQIPIDELASSVNLSSSRLAHLFKSNVGTPIRRYSLWRRIRIAMEHAINQCSLTEGAHYAGFSDSAHFSRVFKEMYGINPSAIVNNQFPISVSFE